MYCRNEAFEILQEEGRPMRSLSELAENYERWAAQDESRQPTQRGSAILSTRQSPDRRRKMKRVLWVLFCIFAITTICTAQSVLYFPQIVEGQAGGFVWGSGIILTNTAAPGTAVASGTLTLTKDDGTPWSLPLTDLQGNSLGSGSVSFQLAGGQATLFLTPALADHQTDTLPLTSGFATVTSNVPLAGSALFDEHGVIAGCPPGIPQCQPMTGRIAEAGVPPATPLTGQTTIAFASTGDNPNSGVAIANPGTDTATITFQLLDTTGTTAGPSVTKTLAANNHTALFINQLFPNLGSFFVGTVRITSDIPVVSTALLFEHNGQFSTFPVFPLQ